MNSPWQNINVFGISIAFRDSIRNTPYQVSMVIQKLGLSGLSAGEKNSLRSVWLCPPYLLRPKSPKSSRSFLWRHADLPGRGDPSSLLSQVSQGETREAGLAGRLSLLYQTIFLLCRPSVPGLESSRYRQGVALGLEDGQSLGDAVHEGAVAASGRSGSQSDWGR